MFERNQQLIEENRKCQKRGSICFVVALAFAIMPWINACRKSGGDIRGMVSRHREAIARLPAEDQVFRSPRSATAPPEQNADQLQSGVLTRDHAREIAALSNPDVHAALARIDAAAARIIEARSRYIPTVTFTHNSTRTFQTPASRNRLNTSLQPQSPAPVQTDAQNFDPITTIINALRRPLLGGQVKQKGDRNSFSEHSTAFTASWTIFDGFIRQAQLLSAKHLYRATGLSLKDVQRLIAQAVDTAYFQVQFAEEQIRIARAEERFGQEQFVETEKLRAAGRATKADVDNFRVRVLAAQANVTAALGLRDTGRVLLAEFLGLEDAMLPDGVTLSPLEPESEYEMTLPDTVSWISRASENRPDIVQLGLLVQSERERMRAARGLYSPSAAVSGSWGLDRGSSLGYSKEDQSSALAFEFRWELYTGGFRNARVREAEASRAEAAARLHRLRLNVQSEVRTVIVHLRDAQQQIRLKREALDTARENRRIVQAGYIAGKETLTRLNEAQRDFIASDADLALSRIRLREAWSNLHAAAATLRKEGE